MLSDQTVYTQVFNDPTIDVKAQADKHIDDLFYNNLLNKKLLANLKRFIPRMPRFCGIPKVHKQNIPLRPIVS